jgi:hypothetical protein
VYYTDPSGNPTVARYLRQSTNPDLADPSSGVVLTSVPHPVGATNHNGGMLAFGADGCLYAGTGDGGCGGPPSTSPTWGESVPEEVDIATSAQAAGRGLNYGWNIMEGTLCFNPATGCVQTGLTLPVFDYPHGNGAFCGGSIIGGYVYRGSATPGLQGTYFYGDFCLQFVKTFQYQNGQATNQLDWPSLQPTGSNITSFGEDAQGELYVVTNLGGVYRIVP